MGMFDNISVSDPLPFTEEMKALGFAENKHTFQTKDLDNTLSSYIIQNNKLYIEKYKTERWVEGDPDSKNPFYKIGRIEREDLYFEEVPYHGEIYFYDFCQDKENKYDCWIEFKAIFTNGTLEKIEPFKFTAEDNSLRKQREKEWAEKFDEQQRAWYNKYFFHTKPYRWFVNRIWYRACYNLGSFFHKLSYKL
jgi:hypothetical protein